MAQLTLRDRVPGAASGVLGAEAGITEMFTATASSSSSSKCAGLRNRTRASASTIGAGRSTATPQHEPARGQLAQRVLEGAKVTAQKGVDRRPGRAGGTHPTPEDGRAGALARLVEQVEQDRQLAAVIELAGEERERVDVQHEAQLVLAQPEQFHQPRGASALDATAELRVIALPHPPACSGSGAAGASSASTARPRH
jgi:hypothetical protein